MPAKEGWLSAAWRLCRPSTGTLHLAFKAIGRALLGVFLIWLNPFDLFHKADEASSNAFQYFMAGHIGHNVQDPPPITVVLFTPSALKTLSDELEEPWTWPLSFSQHAKILDKIEFYQPAALFYDIEFYQDREGEAAFHDTLTGVTGVTDPNWSCLTPRFAPRTPIFMANPPAGQDILKPLCTAGVTAANVQWSGRPNVYPLEAKSGVYEGMATPAKFLFQVACNRLEIDVQKCSDTEKERDDINLVWRTDYGPSQRSHHNDLFAQACPPAAADDGAANASSKAEGVITSCPAAYVIEADKIMLDHSKGTDTALKAALRGQFVLIGTDFPGMSDRVDTPYFGRVPGVFSHVAALDNLMDWGPGYIHAPDDEHFFSLARIGEFAIVALCLFIVAYVIEKLRKRAPSLAHLTHKEAPTRKHGHDALVVLGGIVALIVGVAAALLLISYLIFDFGRLAPLNWIGELAIVWIFAFEETLYAILLVLLVFPLFSRRARAFAYHLVEPPEEAHG